jgi:phage terminase large subunit GpA-like protein
MRTPAETLFDKIRVRTLKPRTRLNTWEWAAQNVRLDARFTARPGLYDVNYTPYMRGPHEWFSDPYVREITGCKSRQVGGTTYLANCLMYAVGEDPGPCLYVTSTLANAQSFSEREWIPRVELSPLLTSLKPDNVDDFKKTEQHFKTCTVKFTGSNSPANLMSRAIRYLFEDEVDTWPEDNETEAPSMDIVESCTLSYSHTRKILRVSTPTLTSGAIWQYYLRGSQHKFYVPCPYCDHRFELLLEQLDFDREHCRNADGNWNLDEVQSRTTLKCPACAKKIESRQQPVMIQGGEWVRTNPSAPREHISWHISALYSPTVSWGQIAKIFLQKKDTPGGLHDFYNHYLGLPFIRRTTSISVTDLERVQSNSPDYLAYDGSSSWICPAEFKLIIMATDVQQSGFWWAQRGVCLDEASYLIDYGAAASWEDLTVLVDRRYKLPGGEKLGIYKSLIDAGWAAKRTAGVYDFCLGSGGRFMPVQGRSAVHGMFQPIRETIFEHKGAFINGVQIRDDLFKEELYIRQIKERVGKWYLPRLLDEYYKKQLTDEQLKSKRTARGTEVMEWEDSGNNHLGDVEKYILGAMHLVSVYLRALRQTPVEGEKKLEPDLSVAGSVVAEVEDPNRYRLKPVPME